MINNSEVVSSNVKRLRLKYDLTQCELAELLDKSTRTISRYENADTAFSVEVLENIADVFSVKVTDLFEISK